MNIVTKLLSAFIEIIIITTTMMTMIIDLINRCHYYSSLQQCERTFSIQQRQTAWICGSHAGCL